MLEEIDELHRNIESHLKRINKQIERLGVDVLNLIKTEIYVHGLGNDLDSLNDQIKDVVVTYESNRDSKVLSEKEKLVENAFLIGNNAKWITTGNVMFNIKKLGEVLSGNTFTDIQSRNFFQIIYEANTLKSLFSGEAYDRSLLYIEKVMQVYFYGCSVMLGILKNSMLLTNFTAEDIEALSPSVNSHYNSCAVSDPMYIENEIASIADRIFNTSSNTSLITLYTQLKFKIKYERNIFVGTGLIPNPIPIADKLNSKIIEYKEMHNKMTADCAFSACPWEDYCVKTLWPYLSRMKSEVQNYADNGVITPRQMEDFYQYFYGANINNGSEVLSYLNDKGIDTAGELAKEISKKGIAHFPLYNFWEDQSSCYYEEGLNTNEMKIKFFTFAIANNTDGSQLKYGLYDLFNINVTIDLDEGDLFLDAYPIQRKIFTFNRAKELIIPETAEEVMEAMDSRNTTTNYSEAIESNAPNGIAELENNENVRVIILGFNGLNKTGDIPYFDMHFTTLNEKFISSFMKIPFNIKHKNNLRNLQNVNNTQSPSGIDYSNSTNLAYHINVKNITENITEIEIIIDLSKNYTNRINILNIFENYTSIVTCEFNKTNDNYNLKCDSNITVNATSDSSFMIIIDTIKDKKIIIIIILIDSNETDTPTGTDIQIKTDSHTGTDTQTGTDSHTGTDSQKGTDTQTGTDSQIESDTSESGYRRYNKESNGKNIAGLIVLLVVLLILAVSATIVTIVSLKKKKKKKTIPAENTVQDATVSSWI